MPFHPRQKAAGNFTPVPEGAHIALCVGVVDIGLQGGGKYEDSYKVVISWVLPNERTDKGNPMTISQTFTNSMNKKANLRKSVESWFGKSFPTEDDANKFDLSLLLGRACMVNVVHKQNGEKTYANVNSVMPVPKGMEKPTLPAGVETIYYAPTDPSQTPAQIKTAYAGLPEWVQKKVDEQLAPPSEEATGEAEGSAGAEAGAEHDDDIPF